MYSPINNISIVSMNSELLKKKKKSYRLQAEGGQGITLTAYKVEIRECDIHLQTNRLHKPKPPNKAAYLPTDSNGQ